MNKSINIFDEFPFPRDVTIMIFRILHKSIVTELNVEYHKKVKKLSDVGLKTYLGTFRRNTNTNMFVFNYRSKKYLTHFKQPSHIYNIRDSTSVLMSNNY